MILTFLQFVSKLLLVHAPKEVQCHLQSPFSGITLILIFMLKILYVVWTQNPLEFLQFIPHECKDLIFKLLDNKY